MNTTFRTIFSAGFRVFFLLAAIFSILAMAAWSFWLGVHAMGGMVTATPFASPPHVWHAHEMIWGYGAAVVAGFFLTAVPNWTNGRPTAMPFLLTVAGLWLVGRLAVWFSAWLDPWFVAVADLAFIPALAAKLVVMLARRPKPQNVMLLGVLILLWTGNLLTHLEWTGLMADGAARGVRMGLVSLVALIAVIGGRVTPAFTRNAMLRAGIEYGLPRSVAWLDATGIAAALLLPLAYAFDAPYTVIAATATAAGTLQALRLAGWRGDWTRHQPILWSMHLAYALLALGYLALALAHWAGTSEIAALHILGIGAIGGMTLTVMTRATLGHTGRALVAPSPVVAAYVCLGAATVLRAAASYGAIAHHNAVTLSAGALWIAAFALFLASLWAPLTRPREAGRN